MRPTNDALAEAILSAAKKSFFHKGYRKTSVRDIAAEVGVTTGALYRYYRNKEALFCALVEEPAESLYAAYKAHAEDDALLPTSEGTSLFSEIDDHMTHVLAHMYENRDAFKLIATASKGTKYENYMERLIDVETSATITLLRRKTADGNLPEGIDELLVHIIVSTMFVGIFEVISHDEALESALKYADTIKHFFAAGWQSILNTQR